MIHIGQADIEGYIASGESEWVEFKTRLPSDASIGRVLSAFANTIGGVLLVGVSDDGQIIGLPDEDIGRAINRLVAIIDAMLPVPSCVGSMQIEGRNIVYAAVEKAPAWSAPVFTSSGLLVVRQQAASVAVRSTDFYDPELRERILSVEADREVLAFVAMSFRNEEEPHLEDYFRAMERAARRTELPIKLVRVDLIEGDYEISQQIMDQITSADILIADFTLNSSNVYFELGYGRASRKRIIQTARKGTALEFDIRNWRTHFYRNATELEEKLIPELKSAYSEVTAQQDGRPTTRCS